MLQGLLFLYLTFKCLTPTRVPFYAYLCQQQWTAVQNVRLAVIVDKDRGHHVLLQPLTVSLILVGT